MYKEDSKYSAHFSHLKKMRKEYSGTIQESCKLAISWSTSYMLHYVMWGKRDPTSQQRVVWYQELQIQRDKGTALVAKLGILCRGM